MECNACKLFQHQVIAIIEGVVGVDSVTVVAVVASCCRYVIDIRECVVICVSGEIIAIDEIVGD